MKILAIVISKMVVGNNGRQSDTRTDQEVRHYRLESCLTRLEVGTSQEGSLLSGILNDTWMERVLWRTIQVKDTLLNCSDAVENGTWQNSVTFDSALEVSNIFDLREEEHFGVSCPKNDDFVNLLLHVLNVLSDFVDAFLIGTRENIVDSIRLVRSNELLIQNSWQRNDLFEVVLQRIDKGWLENVSSLAGLVHVQVADVPSSDLEVNWVDHWHDVFNWLEDILELVGLLVVLVADMGGSTLCERSMEVWMLNSSLGLPRLLLFVGKNTGSEGRTIVTSEANKHNSNAWDSSLSGDLVFDLLDGLNIGFIVPHWDFLLVYRLDDWGGGVDFHLVK